MKYEILDQNRRELLPLFTAFKDRFYLAGGTALALQIGHRQSIDFDFFSPDDFDTEKLSTELRTIFSGKDTQIIQEERGTLTILVNTIQISFLHYPYTLIEPFIDSEYMRIASVDDIGCMKLSAITHRATIKDYVDLYYILKEKKLAELLILAENKFPELDRQFMLKSLVYFGDITVEPLIFLLGFEITVEQTKNFLIEQVKNVA